MPPCNGAQSRIVRAKTPDANRKSEPFLTKALASRLQGVPGVLRRLVICALVAVGCYQPSVSDCTVTCEAATDCVDGQTCRDGFCASPDHAGCGTATVVDGASSDVKPDADLCPQGCTNGTCVDGVCVIDCTAAQSCSTNDIKCPPNIPCRVECGGQGSCGKKILCGLASECTIVCSGESACRDEIVCNTNACHVTCSGPDSCDKRVKCSSSCACDVICSGDESCNETNECPDATCRLGDGCSSQLAGCDSCS